MSEDKWEETRKLLQAGATGPLGSKTAAGGGQSGAGGATPPDHNHSQAPSAGQAQSPRSSKVGENTRSHPSVVVEDNIHDYDNDPGIPDRGPGDDDDDDDDDVPEAEYL